MPPANCSLRLEKIWGPKFAFCFDNTNHFNNANVIFENSTIYEKMDSKQYQFADTITHTKHGIVNNYPVVPDDAHGRQSDQRLNPRHHKGLPQARTASGQQLHHHQQRHHRQILQQKNAKGRLSMPSKGAVFYITTQDETWNKRNINNFN